MRLKQAAFAAVLVCAGVTSSAVTATADNYLRDGAGQAIHWNRDGTELAQVYFIDFTGSRWPVSASTWTWNNSSNVKSYYETGCPAWWLHCVDVNEYSASDGNFGFTEISPTDANGHFTSVAVYLNNNYYVSAADDRQTTCQELGHALGLDHQEVPDSCMNTIFSESQYPNGHDYDQLAAVYNH